MKDNDKNREHNLDGFELPEDENANRDIENEDDDDDFGFSLDDDDDQDFDLSWIDMYRQHFRSDGCLSEA